MAGWAIALVAATAAGGSAAAARTQSPTSFNLTLSGSLAISWQGDPALGCAAEGLCGVHGELILRSYGPTGLGSSGPLSVLSVNVSGTVRVRDDAQSPPGECVEPMGNSEIAPGPGVQLTHGRTWTAVLNPPPSSGRCAGPLATDLSRLALPLTVHGGRYPTFDMRGTRTFAAGPFSATAVSTMVLRTAPAGGGSGGSSGTSFATRPGAPHRVLSEYVTLRYRVSFLPSTLEANFAGATDPICQTVDSCGTTGSVGLSLTRGPATFTLTVSRRVRARVSARRALQDLRAGRLTVDYPAQVSAPGRVAESLTRSGGSTCSETLPVSRLDAWFGPVNAPPTRHTLPISLQYSNGLNLDVLRTHCLGPADADMIGGTSALAATSLTSSQLLAQTNDVALVNPGSFSGLGYTGYRGGAIRLELTLVHVAAGTRRELQ